jgi:hypothetical protein
LPHFDSFFVTLALRFNAQICAVSGRFRAISGHSQRGRTVESWLNVEASGARPLTVAHHRRSRASAARPGYATAIGSLTTFHSLLST